MDRVILVEGYVRDLGLPASVLDALQNGGMAIEGTDRRETVELYNAARPFPCHEEWRGEFVHGVFWGVIYPEREYADEYRKRAISLDAALVTWHTQTEVKAWCKTYYEQHWARHFPDGFDPEEHELRDMANTFIRHARGELEGSGG